MDKINYPLLYYPLTPELVVGRLIAADIEATAPSLPELKTVLLDYLQKQYKKYDEFPSMDLVKPKLRFVRTSTRPTYRDGNSAYPLQASIKLNLPVVYGEVREGFYRCYLPQFNDNFYYHAPKQFETLVKYSLTNWLDRTPPEQVYRMLRYPRPELDTVTLKVNYGRDYTWGGVGYERKFEVLGRLAEQYPMKKADARKLNALPEAAWGLEKEVGTAVEKIVGTRSNLLIVGPHGAGKSAVLRQAIKKITQQSKKQRIQRSFWRILPQRITASSKYLGEWEEVCETLVHELQVAQGILWVENIIRLLLTGGEGPEDSVAAFLMTFLQQGQLQLIGEVTAEELESMRRLLPGFAEAFQTITLEEMPEATVMEVLNRFAAYSAKSLRVPITEAAIAQSYRLLKRYLPYESFPGKGIKFMSRCVSEAKAKGREQVDAELVTDTFVKQTGLPALFLRDDLRLNVPETRAYFENRIIGQPAVIEQFSQIITIYKAGLNNPHRPITSMIFAGPTGVGKTASAQALAEYFFGKGEAGKSPLVRIDMSEFQHPAQMMRLVGHGREPGQLVKDIRERPFSVLLLDEIEKADPTIFDALLGLLDEGIMVDAYGRQTNFRNTIVIMTSNLGASSRASIGFGAVQEDRAAYLSAIRRHFRPEFVNRIDQIVPFRALDADDVARITERELSLLSKREGLEKRGLELRFSDSLSQYVSRHGFDPKYGARPLQRTVEQVIVQPLSHWLLQHPATARQTLKLGLDDKERLTVKRSQ